ncbi:uncharacterized protein LOC114304132, partial [Camellia sinensis]|uniref:uncharacterized protein LOC114304132 n=1 Tax=Camellia sinensis TaxID=4442 RepID=UPI001035C04D
MELLKDYFSRVTQLVNQMKICGDNISNQRVIEKILISLPEKYNPIVAVVEETKDLVDLSIEDLMGSIKTFEQRLSRQFEKSIESAFQSKLNESEGHMFYACHKASDQNKDVWFLNNGCSNHMTGDESIFVKMDASSSSQ